MSRISTNELPDPARLFQRMTIDGTRFQAQKFLPAVNEYDRLREATQEGEKITPTYLPLLSDTFSAFFQNKAKIKTNPPEGLEQHAKQAVESFGTEEGGLKRIPITDQFRLADLRSKNPKVKDIIRLLGRMKLEALSIKRSKVTYSTPVRRGMEPVGIEALDRILPDELSDLALGTTGEERSSTGYPKRTCLPKATRIPSSKHTDRFS